MPETSWNYAYQPLTFASPTDSSQNTNSQHDNTSQQSGTTPAEPCVDIWRSIRRAVSHSLLMIVPVPMALWAFAEDKAIARKCLPSALVVQLLSGLVVALIFLSWMAPMWLAHMLALLFVTILLVASNSIQ